MTGSIVHPGVSNRAHLVMIDGHTKHRGLVRQAGDSTEPSIQRVPRDERFRGTNGVVGLSRLAGFSGLSVAERSGAMW
jgi:hypothetical protein